MFRIGLTKVRVIINILRSETYPSESHRPLNIISNGAVLGDSYPINVPISHVDGNKISRVKFKLMLALLDQYFINT